MFDVLPDAGSPRDQQAARYMVPTLHGVRCIIYSDRPKVCADSLCGWLASERFGLEWKPSVSGIVISYVDPEVLFTVDPERRGRWREPPYFEDLIRFAKDGNMVWIKTYLRIGCCFSGGADGGRIRIIKHEAVPVWQLWATAASSSTAAGGSPRSRKQRCRIFGRLTNPWVPAWGSKGAGAR
jgi:hypothetical protein